MKYKLLACAFFFPALPGVNRRCVCVYVWLNTDGIQAWHGDLLMSSLLPVQVVFTVAWSSSGITDARSRHATLELVELSLFSSSSSSLFSITFTPALSSLAPFSFPHLLDHTLWAFAVCIFVLMSVCDQLLLGEELYVHRGKGKCISLNGAGVCFSLRSPCRY